MPSSPTAAQSQLSQQPVGPSSEVPESCLFSTAESRALQEASHPSLYGLSDESIELNDRYQLARGTARETPAPEFGFISPELPEGAVQWGDKAVTAQDHQRLAEMARIYETHGQMIQARARELYGESYVGIAWSYVDGFIVSSTLESEMAESILIEFENVLYRNVRGIVPESIANSNLQAASKLSRDFSLTALTDPTCGLIFLAFDDARPSAEVLDSLFEPGSYILVDPEFYGGGPPELTVGRSRGNQP